MRPKAIGYAIVDSALGRLLVAATERGVCLVRFGDPEGALRETLQREFPFAVVEADAPQVKAWSEDLVRYVDGRSTELRVPLDVSGSRFRRRVWDALREIPRGETRCYAAVAARLGAPKAARAVAGACAANPVPIAIPCHRVVPKRGGIGGYAGGAERKRALLALEAGPSRVATTAPVPRGALMPDPPGARPRRSAGRAVREAPGRGSRARPGRAG